MRKIFDTTLSCCFRIAIICSSLNRDLFILSVSFVGTDSTSKWRRKWVSGQLEKRQEIYDEIGVPLNDIYVYIADVGHYKSLTPNDIIGHRRFLHTKMHTNRAYWSTETFAAYLHYMDNVAFSTFEGVNIDAKIRDDIAQKEQLPNWQFGWTGLHTGEQASEHRKAYEELLQSLAIDLGVGPIDQK